MITEKNFEKQFLDLFEEYADSRAPMNDSEENKAASIGFSSEKIDFYVHNREDLKIDKVVRKVFNHWKEGTKAVIVCNSVAERENSIGSGEHLLSLQKSIRKPSYVSSNYGRNKSSRKIEQSYLG